jgi:hypothetical protein
MKKVRTQEQLDGLKRLLFNRIHRTGEEIKNNFPNLLRTAIEVRIWEHYRKDDGQPFTDIADWLHYSWPSGTWLGSDSCALNYEDAMQLCEGHADVYDVLVQYAPKAKRGGDRRSKKARENQSSGTATLIIGGSGKNNRSSVLSVRLREHFPEHYQKYLSGEYKSIWAAAVAAGIVKVPTALETIKRLYGKLSAEERRQLRAWQDATDAKS